MKILINAFSARLGGGQTYITNLLKHCPVDKNFQIFLLCDRSLKTEGFPKNINILNTTGFQNPIIRAFWENLFIPIIAYKNKINLVFSPGGLQPFFLKFMNVKTAVTFQNMLPFDEKQRNKYPYSFRLIREWILRYLLTSSMRNADFIIYISKFAKNFIHKNYKIYTKSNTIYHGIDSIFINKSSVSPKYLKSVLSGKYFTYVSFIDFYKNQVEIVKGFKKYLNHGGMGRLLLIGSEYKFYGDIVRAEIEKLDLCSDVIMVGNIFHHDLPFVYQHAAVNIFASSTENCPNILLEIMASKKPALISNSEPMPEIAKSFVSYFDPLNPNDFAQQLLNITSNKSKKFYSALSSKAYLESKKYSWEATSNITWKALVKIANSPI